MVNPLKYKADRSIKRKLYLVMKDINYKRKYKKLNGKSKSQQNVKFCWLALTVRG